MFPSFEPFTIETQSNPPVSISGLKSPSSSNSPSLPPLVLLHGFPQSLHAWHLVAPALTSHYTVILLNLRGYLNSSKPADDVSQYAKSVMARDCIVVVDNLGFKDQPFFVCAHDRGARVAHKLLVDYPSRIRKAILLDICPTLAMYETPIADLPKYYFHWYFLIQPAPFPEALISAAPQQAFEGLSGGKHAKLIFAKEAAEFYTKGFEDPAQVHAMCQDYRASASIDLEEAKADLKAARLIKSPIRVLLGKKGVVARFFEGQKEWEAVTEEGVEVDVRDIDTGHFIPEEAPDVIVQNILEFLK